MPLGLMSGVSYEEGRNFVPAPPLRATAITVGSAGFLPVRSDVRNNFRKLAYNSC
jgi:hypothetical protein